MEWLSRQTFRNFEVIVVDQSAAPWAPATTPAFELIPCRPTSGAGTRATSAPSTPAVTCSPSPTMTAAGADWLEAGLRYFRRSDVVGVEGSIVSDRVNDPGYRPVTNVGFEGIGFMTANLLLRREISLPSTASMPSSTSPFREDTDLAWRALACGKIPFGRTSASIIRHSAGRFHGRVVAERLTFFEKDALLLKKHPERYRTLFVREAHYAKTRGFTEQLRRGAIKYGVTLDEFYLSRCARHE